MCVQGLIQGVRNPKDSGHNIVIVGRGEEYYLFRNGQFQTAHKMLVHIQAAYGKLVRTEHADEWPSVKTIHANAFGYKVLT